MLDPNPKQEIGSENVAPDPQYHSRKYSTNMVSPNQQVYNQQLMMKDQLYNQQMMTPNNSAQNYMDQFRRFFGKIDANVPFRMSKLTSSKS